MTSTYRREHEPFPRNDEFERLGAGARANITAAVTSFEALYPLPAASAGEVLAAKRALARFLIDSGKASLAGQL